MTSSCIPNAFDGFTILQLSDLHVEMSEGAMMRLDAMLPDIDYDLCVLTGDYRAQTFGSYETALAGMARLCSTLKRPIYGVLGNHDTIRMVPGLEDMGIQMLLNENRAIERGNQRIYLAGIDDAHFYRVDNIEKAATGIPFGNFSILLSHTPEVYQQASYADFSLLLSGHTHGGQICLPGRIPITLDSVLPRHMGSGAWKYRDMVGYTSVGAGSSIVPVRFNCRSFPKIISAHSDGVVRTISAWPRWCRIVGLLVAGARPWPIRGACASRCNKANITSGPSANAVRRKLRHDPNSRAGAFRSSAQHRGSARATAVKSGDRVSPSF